MNEQKNLIFAIIASIFILLGWQYFFEPPMPDNKGASQDAATTGGSENAQTGDNGIAIQGDDDLSIANNGTNLLGSKTREDALNKNPRIPFSNDRISGSINLKGGRIDDVTLLDYRQELSETSDKITLFQPIDGKSPYYADFSWIGKDVALPNGETIWQASHSSLTPNSPVTLTWVNPDNIVFEKEISLDKNYLFTDTLRVKNLSNNDIELAPYNLISRKSKPDTANFYILHEGLIGVLDETLQEVDYDDILDERRNQFDTTGGWLGITDKYWLSAIIPAHDASVKASFNAISKNGVPQFQVDFLNKTSLVKAGDSFSHQSLLFAGAKETLLLDEYGAAHNIDKFDKAVDFGWFYFLTKPIYYAIHYLNEFFGNLGLAIIALTVVVKMILLPLAYKSYASMSKMKLLQPEMEALKNRYGDDKQKMQQEMFAMYKREKVNPLSGCLPILLQIPVFFSLYKVLFVTIEMRHAPFFGWISDLSAPDPYGILTGFGLFDWQVTGILTFVNIGVWPIIMGLTMWVQQKLNPTPTDPIQAKIFAIMPIMFTFILAPFPAGLVIYWAWNNLLTIAQQWVIMRRVSRQNEQRQLQKENEKAKKKQEAAANEKKADNKKVTLNKNKKNKKKGKK